MPDVKRQVKIVTEQHEINKPSPMEGFPMRAWNIEVFLIDSNGNDVPATVFDKVTYKLHESFGNRATQVKKEVPFRIEEEGWGEFDMAITFSGMNKGGNHEVAHDLHFRELRYEEKHNITFKNPKGELLERLKESGIPGDENGTKGSKGGESMKKKSRKAGNVDMEKLAEGLQKLNEDDLLQVVQMVHDNKSADTYTKNDVENGEFHVDLYTLPDPLVKMLWEFTGQRTDL